MQMGIVSAPTQLTAINPPSTVTPSPVITSTSTPTSITTPSKRVPGNSYVELHLSKLRHPGANTVPSVGVAGSSSQPIVGSGMMGAKQHPQIFQRSSLGNLVSTNPPNKAEKHGSIRRTSLDGVTAPVARHHSLPEEMDTPLLSVVVSGPSDEKVFGNPMDMQPDNSMSLTWPRANLALTTSGSTGPITVPPLKGPVQINADPLGMAGGKWTIQQCM